MADYLVFTFYAGRSNGGMNDFLDRFPSIEEALDNILPEPERYFQIVDARTMRPVREGLSLYKEFSDLAFRKES
jgi:hypothetical protein